MECVCQKGPWGLTGILFPVLFHWWDGKHKVPRSKGYRRMWQLKRSKPEHSMTAMISPPWLGNFCLLQDFRPFVASLFLLQNLKPQYIGKRIYSEWQGNAKCYCGSIKHMKTWVYWQMCAVCLLFPTLLNIWLHKNEKFRIFWNINSTLKSQHKC